MSGVRVVYHYRANPGQLGVVTKEWSERADLCRSEEGCLQYDLFQNLRVRDELVMLEWWANQQAYDAHWQRELERSMPAPDAY